MIGFAGRSRRWGGGFVNLTWAQYICAFGLTAINSRDLAPTLNR